jgi:hypothetical protein
MLARKGIQMPYEVLQLKEFEKYVAEEEGGGEIGSYWGSPEQIRSATSTRWGRARLKIKTPEIFSAEYFKIFGKFREAAKIGNHGPEFNSKDGNKIIFETEFYYFDQPTRKLYGRMILGIRLPIACKTKFGAPIDLPPDLKNKPICAALFAIDNSEKKENFYSVLANSGKIDFSHPEMKKMNISDFFFKGAPLAAAFKMKQLGEEISEKELLSGSFWGKAIRFALMKQGFAETWKKFSSFAGSIGIDFPKVKI